MGIAKYDSTKNENEGVEVESFPTLKFFNKDNKTNGGMEVKYNHDDGKQVASLKNYLRKNSAAYKSARPDEKVEADDFKEEAADEGKEGEDGGEGDMAEEGGDDAGDEPKEGEDDMTEEQMKKMEEEMKNMTPEEKAKMEKEMGEMAETNEGADDGDSDAPGGEPKEAEAEAADAKKEDL